MRGVLLILAATIAFSPPRTLSDLSSKPHTSAATYTRGGSPAAATKDELIGEATGTAILLTFGYGAVATSAIDGALTLPGVAAVWGLGVALGVLASNDLSGAHLNPAVTAALAATNKFPVKKVAPYVAAQLVGGVAASVLTSATRGLALATPAPWIMGFPGLSAARACFVEGWTTALLATMVMVTGGRRHAGTVPAKGGPFIVGITVAGMICLVGPLTGAGFNPARDLSPRIVAALAGGAGAFPAGWWIYSAGPVVGAVLGAALCLRCLGSDKHDYFLGRLRRALAASTMRPRENHHLSLNTPNCGLGFGTCGFDQVPRCLRYGGLVDLIGLPEARRRVVDALASLSQPPPASQPEQVIARSLAQAMKAMWALLAWGVLLWQATEACEAAAADIKPTQAAQDFLQGLWQEVRESEAVATARLGARLKAMREWAEDVVAESWSKRPVVYPFSGMDLVTAVSLFPDAPLYSLVAPFASGGGCLEDDACMLKAASVARLWFRHAESRRWRTSNTQYMTKLFNSPAGVLPVLLLSIELLDSEVLDVQDDGPLLTVHARCRRDGRCFIVRYLSSWISADTLPAIADRLWTRETPVAFLLKAAPYEIVREAWFSARVVADAAVVMADEMGIRPAAYDLGSGVSNPLEVTCMAATTRSGRRLRRG